MKNKHEINPMNRIVKAIKKIKSDEEIGRFLTELLTDNELKDMENRWILMEMLNKGVTQREIAKELKISLCKITRGSKLLKDETSVVGQIIKKLK